MRAAVGFLTTLGGSRLTDSRKPGPGTAEWFGPVGAILGTLLGGLWWVAAHVWTAGVAAAVVVVADLALTGMLHLDGLVDSADGLLAPMERDRRLAAMAAPEVGAFGVGAGGAALLLRWAALAAIPPAIPLLCALWLLSRTLMAGAIRFLDYARPAGGLASGFAGQPRGWVLTGAVAGAVVLASAWKMLAGPVAIACGLMAGVGVLALGRRRIGGYTGDVLGASGFVLETVGLLVAAARW